MVTKHIKLNLKNIILFVCVCIIQNMCVTSVLFSQGNIAHAQTQTLQLQGLDRASVIRLLGQPQRSSAVPSGPNSNSSETLYYGDSQVSLINNKVNSIFDLGEIKAALSKSKQDIDNNTRWTPWPNPWTPPQSIVNEIIPLGN